MGFMASSEMFDVFHKLLKSDEDNASGDIGLLVVYWGKVHLPVCNGAAKGDPWKYTFLAARSNPSAVCRSAPMPARSRQWAPGTLLDNHAIMPTADGGSDSRGCPKAIQFSCRNICRDIHSDAANTLANHIHI